MKKKVENRICDTWSEDDVTEFHDELSYSQDHRVVRQSSPSKKDRPRQVRGESENNEDDEVDDLDKWAKAVNSHEDEEEEFDGGVSELSEEEKEPLAKVAYNLKLDSKAAEALKSLKPETQRKVLDTLVGKKGLSPTATNKSSTFSLNTDDEKDDCDDADDDSEDEILRSSSSKFYYFDFLLQSIFLFNCNVCFC